MKSQFEVPEQKEFVVYTTGKWLETVAVIFVSVWLSVAVLKLAGELLAYYLSMRNLRRMSLPVNDPVSTSEWIIKSLSYSLVRINNFLPPDVIKDL